MKYFLITFIRMVFFKSKTRTCIFSLSYSEDFKSHDYIYHNILAYMIDNKINKFGCGDETSYYLKPITDESLMAKVVNTLLENTDVDKKKNIDAKVYHFMNYLCLGVSGFSTEICSVVVLEQYC